MASKKTIEVLIDELHLDTYGVKKSKTPSSHILTLEVVWPRPTIQSKTYLKTIKLVDGKFIIQDKSWLDRIILKESVEGPFGIRISISAALSDELLKKFFSQVFKTVFSTASSMSEALVEDKALKKSIALPLDFISSNLKSDNYRTIAEAEFVVSTENFSKSNPTISISSNLICPSEWSYRSSSTSSSKSSAPRKKIILHKNSTNGSISLSIADR